MYQRTSFPAWRAVIAAAALALPAALSGQSPVAEPRLDLVLGPPDEGLVAPTLARPTGFSLFANADFAVAGVRASGGVLGSAVDNYGPCIQQVANCGIRLIRNGWWSTWFEISWVAGAPPHEFRKIRNIHPGVSAAINSQGYSYQRNAILVGARPTKFGPTDGTLGNLFSGVTTSTDNSCRDFSSGFTGFTDPNVTMLAVSDCPESWGAFGWQGPKVIGDSAFIRAFNANPNGFTFDFWKIPPSEIDQSSRLGDYTIVGATTDHYSEVLAQYGSVTPRGSGAPVISGYPLGLDIEWSTFTFALPQLANVEFFQALIINRSQDVYGQGIDYDSLYFGLQPGPNFQNSASWYFDPARGALMHNYGSTTLGCNGAIRPAAVAACLTGDVRGFYHGAAGLVVYKSPIGDLRNKLLSRDGSPFFNPTSPHADDTLTFNQGRICTFGGSCEQWTQFVNDKRGFGTLASQETATLDGRDPSTLTTNETWYTFRSIDYRGVPGPTVARYNRYAPPGWDYDEDGDFDTLSVDTCGPAGCVVNWADTMPGKQVNRGGNIGGHMAAGPFKLAAGDTTAFIFSMIVAADSASFEGYIDNSIDAYLNLFLGPQVAPPPTVIAATVTSAEVGSEVGDNPEVRLTFSSAPEDWVDPYLTKLASSIELDPSFRVLRTLNPTLADEVRARASNNLSEVWVFKSCDAGVSWTSDADCDGDRLTDPRGNAIAGGWRPYFIFSADAAGNISNELIDPNVEGGRTYLYSLVSRTRGFRIPVRDSVDGVEVAREFVVADTLTSGLQTNGPTTATVYVPISIAAGGSAPTSSVAVVAGTSTVPVRTTVLQSAVAGDYRLVFGNRFIVRIETNTETDAVTSTVIAEDTLGISADLTGGGVVVDTGAVFDADTLTGPGRLNFAGVTFAPTTTTVGNTRVEVDTLYGLGFVFARGNAPFFLSTSIRGGAVIPESFRNRADFPGIYVTLNQDSSNVLVTERLLQANGDTVSLVAMDTYGVNLQTGTGQTVRAGAAGLYEVRWRDDAYGPAAPFSFGPRAALEPAVQASLQSRAVASTGATTPEIAALVYAADPTLDGKPLVAAKFPFTVVTPSGAPAILAMVERDQLPGGDNQILIGARGDTTRVTVPEDVWVPGDRFFVLEVKQVDSVTAEGRQVIRDGAIVQMTDTVVAFAPMLLGCTARLECNPIRVNDPGETGYLRIADGWRHVLDYPRPFTAASEIAVTVVQGTPPEGRLTRADLAKIRVVPNPYIVQSDFDRVLLGEGQSRLYFTGVPQEGALRIYSVSGQFLQQLQWTAADLNGTGDLQYDLLTREGTELATGLYLYVITPGGTNRGSPAVRGKFVVIR